MEIRYAKIAHKALQSYDKPTKARIREKIHGLTETPPKGDIKPLEGSQKEYRLRVGKYRVIYEYTEENKLKILQINKIDSRGDVYK